MEIFTTENIWSNEYEKVSSTNIYEHDFLSGVRYFDLLYKVKTIGGCKKSYYHQVRLTGYEAQDYSSFPTDINASLLKNGKYTFDINVSAPLDKELTVEIYKGSKYSGGIKVSDTHTYTHDFFRDHSFDLFYYVYNKNGVFLGVFNKHIQLINYEFQDHTSIPENLKISDLNDGKYTFDINVSSSIEEDIEILIEVRDINTGKHTKVSDTGTYTHDFINGKKNFTLYYRIKSLAGYTHGIKNIKLVDYALIDHSLFSNRIDIRDLVDGKYTFEMNITSPFDENLSYGMYYAGDKILDGKFYTHDFNQKSSFNFNYGATTQDGYFQLFHKYIRLKNDELIDNSTFPTQLNLTDLDNGKYTFDFNISSIIGLPLKYEVYKNNTKVSDNKTYTHDFSGEKTFLLSCVVTYPSGYRKTILKQIVLSTKELTMYTRNQKQFLGKYETGNYVFDVAVSKDENISYLAEGEKGLTILDITDITNPVKIGGYDTDGMLYSITLSKDKSKIFLTDSVEGLVMLDISNPTTPELIDKISMEGAPYSVVISDDENTAYVSDADKGLVVVDMTNPYNLIIKSTIDTKGNCMQTVLSADETKAYISDAQNGLLILDINNSEKAVELGHYVTDGYVFGIALDENNQIVYLADMIKGLFAIDVSNASHPQLIDLYESNPMKVTLSPDKTKAYLSVKNKIAVLDISNAQTMTLQKGFDAAQLNYTIVLSKDKKRAYVASDKQGLTIVDLFNTSQSNIFESFHSTGYAYGVALSYDEKRAFVPNGKDGFLVVDISDDNNFSLIQKIDTGDDARDITLFGSSAYVTNADSGLTVIDLFTDPLKITNTFDTDGWTHDVQYLVNENSHFLYLADGSGGFKILENKDVWNGEDYVWRLKLLGSILTEGNAHSLAISNDKQRAYVVNNGNTMVVIDITNPVDLKIIGRWQNLNGSFQHIVLSKDNKKAYIADKNNGLLIFDLSDPVKPILIHTVNLHGRAETIVFSNNELFAYITTGDGVAMVSFLNAQAPEFVKKYPISVGVSRGYTDGIVLNKNETKAYVAAGDNGLVGLDLTVDKVYYPMNFQNKNVELQLPKDINVTLDFSVELDNEDIIELGDYDTTVELN